MAFYVDPHDGNGSRTPLEIRTSRADGRLGERDVAGGWAVGGGEVATASCESRSGVYHCGSGGCDCYRHDGTVMLEER